MRIRFVGATILLVAIYFAYPVTGNSSTRPDIARPGKLILSESQYRDRVRAIWTAQMIAQMTGLLFEHKPASVLKNTPLVQADGFAPVDDDYYYEMVAIRAFERYGIRLTVRQLGAQWLENNAGSWGSSEQTLLLLKRGIEPPDTGSPRYNKLWWTIGPQFSSDVYGALAPGMPNVAAEMARRLTHINGYAEGTDGAVFVSGMVSLGFVETDTRVIVRKAAHLISPLSPYRQCLDMVIAMAEAGKSPQEISQAIDERWGVEYPATNNAVLNGGIVAMSVWFGGGDFSKTVSLAATADDFSDADCNAANSASVVAAMHGMSALPVAEVMALQDRVRGDTMGPLKMTPPVNESISALAYRTAAIGEKILLDHGATLVTGKLIIPTEQTATQAPELFKLSDLTTFWNPAWSLERAGFGGAGGGLPGIRGDTYLDGSTLAVFPRDEVRGALLRRTVDLNDKPSLSVDVGADAGRAWRLMIFVNNDKLLSQLIQGDSLRKESGSEHLWTHIDLDLSNYRNQSVVIRLYDLVLVPGLQAGNSYWRNPQIH
jgi:ADP-ribosylglycohydrolase